MKGKLDELTVEELNRSLREAKEELRKERFKRTVSRVENPKKNHATEEADSKNINGAT